MPDLINSGKVVHLSVHLSAPNTPQATDNVRQAIMFVFQQYWNNEIDVLELQGGLNYAAGRVEALEHFKLWLFLNKRDIN